MPEISRFYGIVIYMFFNDHNPPHFKVKYGEFEANILIENGSILWRFIKMRCIRFNKFRNQK